MTEQTNIIFAPLLSGFWIGLLIAACFITLLLFNLQNKRLPIFKSLFLVLLLIVLLNPVRQKITGEPTQTAISIISDSSLSQAASGRNRLVSNIEQQIVAKLSNLENVDLKTKTVDDGDSHLFTALEENLQGTQINKRGGAIFITDGQIPVADIQNRKITGPLHIVLTGDQDRYDRRLHIMAAPGYAKLNSAFPVKLEALDTSAGSSEKTVLTVKLGDRIIMEKDIPLNQPTTINLPITRAGEAEYAFSIPIVQGEVSPVNNTAIVNTIGVRDRLRVLLVSGQPHQGLRIWRNLLKSDPSVDLVHFTILRDFDSIDITPPNQMALIPFPTEELFENRIKDFDLIIMDRYTRRNILLPEYFLNIVNFVENGGGLLVAHGTEETNEDNLSETVLRDVFPSLINQGAIRNEAVIPQVTDMGRNHPILAQMGRTNDYGSWYRYLSPSKMADQAQILLETSDGAPLLLTREVGQGRVAQFLSDQIWLWARGHHGGGPYAQLMKRISHWLMHEPSLEYNPLKIEQNGDKFEITYSDEQIEDETLLFTLPTGETINLEFSADDTGVLKAEYVTDMPGYYQAKYGGETASFTYGDLNSAELQNLITTRDKLEELVQSSGGSFIDAQDIENINFDLISSRRNYRSGNNIYFEQSRDLNNRTVESTALLPPWLLFLFAVFFLFMGWRRQE